MERDMHARTSLSSPLSDSDSADELSSCFGLRGSTIVKRRMVT